jgi:hypothetical protein
MASMFTFAGTDPEAFADAFSGTGSGCASTVSGCAGSFDVDPLAAAAALIEQRAAVMGWGQGVQTMPQQVQQARARAAGAKRDKAQRSRRAARGRSGRPMTPSDARQEALRAGLPPPEPGQDPFPYAQPYPDPYAQPYPDPYAYAQPAYGQPYPYPGWPGLPDPWASPAPGVPGPTPPPLTNEELAQLYPGMPMMGGPRRRR